MGDFAMPSSDDPFNGSDPPADLAMALRESLRVGDWGNWLQPRRKLLAYWRACESWKQRQQQWQNQVNAEPGSHRDDGGEDGNEPVPHHLRQQDPDHPLPRALNSPISAGIVADSVPHALTLLLDFGPVLLAGQPGSGLASFQLPPAQGLSDPREWWRLLRTLRDLVCHVSRPGS